MRFILMLMAALVASAPAVADGPAAPPTFLQATEALRAAGFKGVVAVGDANGPVISAAIGEASYAPLRKHRIDEIWPWASVTKQVTAMLVMQEVERGRLSLDQSLASTLPDYRGAGGAATIRQLLQHTSGLPNPEAGPKGAFDAPAFFLRARAQKAQATDALGFCAGAPAASPGARFEYNNCDYIALGAVLERLNGVSFATLVRERIAVPLGLETLVAAPRKRSKRRDVVGYRGAEVAPPLNEATYGAGGMLFGSAEDMLAFDRALVDGRLLGEESRRVMWTGDPSIGYVAPGAWVFPAALTGCPGDVTLVERRGAIGGVQVRNIIAPEKKRMVVIFTNEAGFDFGEIWRGEGWSHTFASAAFCRAGA